MDAYAYKSMEQILIEQVQKRPEIYDKSTAAYRNPRIREDGWKEVAKAVNIPDVEAVKKRWRTLRDSFIKIHKTSKYNPKQVVKWLYYKPLLFLIPHTDHADSKQVPLDEALKNESDETQDTMYGDCELDSGSDHQFVPEEVSYRERRRSKRVLEEEPLLTTKIREDPSEHFLLSCLPALKRLKPRDNAIARMRIQQVLFDVEFGKGEEEAGMPVSKVEEDDD